jgi:hypothetical protein
MSNEITWRRIKIEKAKPYDSGLLWDTYKRFDIQNMLYRQVNFPAYFHTASDPILGIVNGAGDQMERYWSDRDYHGWENACQFLSEKYPNQSFEGFISSSTPEDFLAFVKYLHKEGDITGARLLRYTNASSGYPTYAIDVFIKSPQTPETPLYSGQMAPNVEYNDGPGRRSFLYKDEEFDDGYEEIDGEFKRGKRLYRRGKSW